MAGTREDICATKVMEEEKKKHSFNLNGLYLGSGMLAPCAGRLSKEISPICIRQRQTISLSFCFSCILIRFFLTSTNLKRSSFAFAHKKEVHKPQTSAGAHGRKRWKRRVFKFGEKIDERANQCASATSRNRSDEEGEPTRCGVDREKEGKSP